MGGVVPALNGWTIDLIGQLLNNFHSSGDLPTAQTVWPGLLRFPEKTLDGDRHSKASADLVEAANSTGPAANPPASSLRRRRQLWDPRRFPVPVSPGPTRFRWIA